MTLIRLDRLMLAGVVVLGACAEPRDVETPVPTGPTPPTLNRSPGFPEGWGGGAPASYIIGTDADARTGTKAGYIVSTTPSPTGFAVLTQSVRADDYRGKRVRWSAWVRHTSAQSAGLWMRVDGFTATLAFDNMAPRPIVGAADWHQVDVVLDVANNAAGIAYGLLLSGPGDIVIDDMKLEVVDGSTAETDLYTEPVGSTDSTTMAAFYARRQAAPVNLDFEGMATVDPTAVAWLVDNSLPLTTTDPAASLTELAPLGDMIGDARIVGLGEGTHGTREFFRMKHRIFRYLVEQKGFTHFAIEATWPEAEAINRYVLEGAGGPPAPLIRNMYFWTWDTEEVLDLVNWMRQWNTTAPQHKRVQFQGFDMQYPGHAIDIVEAFVQLARPSDLAFVHERFACIARYRNTGAIFVTNPSGYTVRSADYKAACADSLSQVHKLLKDNEAALEQVTSDEQHARALQAARVVLQFERMTAAGSPLGSYVRDSAMAENTDWLLTRAGPTAKMVLWAHNYHVGRTTYAQGKHLATKYGTAYRNLGFLFGSGLLTVVNGVTFRLETMSTSLAAKGSLEAHFQATGRSYALLDARQVSQSDVPATLRVIPMRSIGSVFNPNVESAYFSPHLFPDDFDLLIYVATTANSRRLP